MATFNLAITYPDGEGPRILTALKAHYNNPDMTNAEAIEAFRQSVRNSLRDIVFRQEQDAARVAADASVTPVNPS